MSAESPVCLSDADLRRLLHELLEAEELTRAEAHLEDCSDCLQRLDQLSGSGAFDAQLLKSDPTRDPLPLALLDSAKAISTEVVGIGEEEIRAYLEPAEDPELMGMIGPYEVTRLIAQGGMGMVLEANDPELARRVAIKLLAPELAVSVQARERFLREARAIAALEHENIMPVYAVDQSGVLPYLVMPVIDGGSLQDLLKQGGGIPMDRLIQIAKRVARALAAAHAEGIIHRDIKPANIMLDGEGERVFLADFGLALAAEDHRLTRSGGLAGTPQYMAPELANDEPADERSDVWSLGAVLYAMATGKPAFPGKTLLAVVRSVSEFTPPTPRQVNPDVPNWLSELIMRCLEKDPADRIASADELLERLKEKSSPPRRLRRPTWQTVFAGLGLLCVLAWMLVRPSGPTPAAGGPPNAPDSWLQLAGEDAKYQRLQAVIDAAQDGDVIEVFGDQMPVEPAEITGKFLTVRPGEGHRPKLLLSATEGHLFKTDSPLILEGLSITNNVSWDPPEIVFSSGAPLMISNCRISRAGISNRNPRRPAIFRTVDTPLVDFRYNLVFAAQSGLLLNDVVSSNHQARIEFHGNAIAANNIYMTRHDTDCPVTLNIHSNSFVCIQTFSFRPGDPRGLHKFHTSANCFDFSHALFWLPLADWDLTTTMIKWKGVNNLYSLSGRMLSFDQRMRKAAPPRRRLKMWRDIKGWRIQNPMEGELPAHEVLDAKRSHPGTIQAGDFLPPEVYQEQGLGPKSAWVGPGAAYEAYRLTGAYRAWSAEARRICEAARD